MNKDEPLMNFLKLVNNKFGENTFHIIDHWNIYEAIGLQKNNKLIYIEHLKLNNFFYECELLLDDPEEVYIVYSTDFNVTAEELLEIMSKFFEIKIL